MAFRAAIAIMTAIFPNTVKMNITENTETLVMSKGYSFVTIVFSWAKLKIIDRSQKKLSNFTLLFGKDFYNI